MVLGTALAWFKSYLAGRVPQSGLGSAVPPCPHLPVESPKGQFLVPFSSHSNYNSYSHFFKQHGNSFHCYADDAQVIQPPKSLMDGVDNIKTYMLLDFLDFNESKEQIVMFGSFDPLGAPVVNLGAHAPCNKPFASNLTVIFDSDFKFHIQINSVAKASFFQL